ncbi:MAG: protein kinase domain-containing protein [Lachnospiraceae bacterium]
MNTQNIMNICYNCFSNLEDSTLPCPHCGFDLEENRKKYPVALQAGTVLNNRYIVGRVLGQGGFGITYLSWDTKLQAKVAVKEFMPNEIATRIGTTVSVAMESRAEDFTYGAERFQEEARTLAKFMGQPGIAGVTDYFDENDTSYFVMDYIEGISFKTYIANQGGKVTVDEALNVMIPVLRALTAVHQEGFIHRDVTPDNIYISKDGNVKLLDFGSARYSIGDKSKSLDVILKVGYAPKEQYIRRGRQGPYTDVYSCAACFYAALTGYLPPESLERLDQDTLIPPSQAGIELPLYLERAILKGLAVQPEDRFQSAAEFLDAIENQQVVELAEAREVSDGSAEGQTTGRKQKRNPFLMGGIAAAVAVLVGIGVFMGGGQTGTEPAIGTPAGEEPSRQDDGPPLLQSEVPSITIRGEEYSTELRELDLEGMGLDDSEIQDLKYMINLTYLNLRGNDITDLSPLSDLKQLRRLALPEGPSEISDLSPLSGMTQMENLDLPVNCPISDLSPLSGMTKLKELRFTGGWRMPTSEITDLAPLEATTWD